MGTSKSIQTLFGEKLCYRDYIYEDLNILSKTLPPNVLVTVANKLEIFSFDNGENLFHHQQYVIPRKYPAHVLYYAIVNE